MGIIISHPGRSIVLERLKGENGKSEVIQLLMKQTLVEHNTDRADFLYTSGTLESFHPDTPLISVGENTTDVYFILTGAVRIHVGRFTLVDAYPAGNQVGEIAAIEITVRTTTVTPVEPVIALKVTKENFVAFLDKFPAASKTLALDFANRLISRNKAIAKPGKRFRIFAISSSEALPVAMSGTKHFSSGGRYEYTPWPAEVFRVAHYPMEDLEAELDRADFAIAIAQGDDIAISRGGQQPSPRDNVLFELGLFMGRLGRKRTILMVPEGKEVKLPSDLKGLSIIEYPEDFNTNSSAAIAVWHRVKECIDGALA